MSREYRDGLFSGPFGLCSGVWDKRLKKYIKATDTEIGVCCMRTNEPLVKECTEKCPTLKTKKLRANCAKTCSDITKLSQANCMLSGKFWEVDKNPIFIGSNQYGCGDELFKQIDKECMKKNKEDILRLCRKNCTPSPQIDCTKHCEYSWKFLVDPETMFLTHQVSKLNDHLSEKELDGTPTGSGNSVYVGYALGVIVIILGLYILFKRFVRKT